MKTIFRKRTFPESNYSAIFINGKTIRIPIDKDKEITELVYPEFYDVTLGTKCLTGKCPWCYASASSKGVYYKDTAQKVREFFGKMDLNQRPFQVAIGGANEPLEHEELEETMKAFTDLDIIPNVTTNGVLINKEKAEMLKKYSGGVAVTLHPHLEKFWRSAVEILIDSDLKLNFHTIISDEKSIEYTERLYNEYASRIDYFVILPYMNVGFGAKNPKDVNYQIFNGFMDRHFKDGKIAIGANGYKWMKENQARYNIQLYPPEIFSKYLHLDENLSMYNNSFSMTPVKYEEGKGVELGKVREFA